MRGRQVCWSDPSLQALAENFIPATDEVWRLHNRKELDCLFFQGFCEEGHYGGRKRPSTTRQGIYCCTPSGKFLASINTTNPERMAQMLRKALDQWARTPHKARLLDYDPAERSDEIRRNEQKFPKDGLPLRVYTRDLPREDLPDDWRRTAWNVDSLWYREAEARRMLPKTLKVGEHADWPKSLVGRLVRRNLVDNARGQTRGYTADQVETARITATVVSIEADVVVVRLEGESRTTTGSWPKDGSYESVAPAMPFARGIRTKMFGEAAFDVARGRFTRFALAAAGTRWGGTRYNFRQDDFDESPIGFAVVFDERDPGRRIAPAEVGQYGW